jgi:hypothetical protein
MNHGLYPPANHHWAVRLATLLKRKLSVDEVMSAARNTSDGSREHIQMWTGEIPTWLVFIGTMKHAPGAVAYLSVRKKR